MSPVIFRIRGFHASFFSREERRIHVHVWHADGEAKFWVEPAVALAHNYSMPRHRLAAARRLVEEHADEIRTAWKAHGR